jgi:PhoPQ-activated pathogenicity-related protein
MLKILMLAVSLLSLSPVAQANACDNVLSCYLAVSENIHPAYVLKAESQAIGSEVSLEIYQLNSQIWPKAGPNSQVWSHTLTLYIPRLESLYARPRHQSLLAGTFGDD